MTVGKRPQTSKFGSSATSRYAFLRIGEIVSVDYETLVASVEYIDGSGIRTEIPLTQAMAGPRSFLGGIPEEGSIVILGWKRYVDDHAIPLILGYLPKGYLSQFNYDPISLVKPSADIPIEDYPSLLGTKRYKLRKIYPGNILGSSAQGADLVLDRNVRLYSASGDELFLRGDDHTLHLNTLNCNQTLASGRRYSGLIDRSKLLFPADIFDEDGGLDAFHPAWDVLDKMGWINDEGTLLSEVNFDQFPVTVLPNGKRYYVVPGPEDYNLPFDSQLFSYVEDRLEIDHLSDGSLSVSNSIDGVEIDQKYPLIERVYGTYVGNSVFTDSDRYIYGKVLRPVLFTGQDVIPGDVTPTFLPCLREGDDEDKRVAAAHVFRMICPDGRGEVFIAHDKQGHGFYHFPATTGGHPLGEGKSVSFNTAGQVKAVLGRDGINGKSLELTSGGSIDLILGQDKIGRSLNIKANGTAIVELKGKDNEGNSYRFICEGMSIESFRGGKISNVFGIWKDDVSGSKNESYGKLSTKVIGEMATLVGEKKSLTVKGDVEATYGAGIKETIIAGSFERENLVGDSKLTLIAGNQVAILTLGSIDETLTAGDRKTTIVAGNYDVSVVTGNVSLNVKTGNIDIKTLAGNINIDAIQVNVKAKAKIVLDSPMVDIGKILAGGVVAGAGPPNPAGHLDFMTGMPIMGSPTVKV